MRLPKGIRDIGKVKHHTSVSAYPAYGKHYCHDCRKWFDGVECPTHIPFNDLSAMRRIYYRLRGFEA